VPRRGRYGRRFILASHPHTVQVDAADGHRRLTADHILLAVGTRPSKPQGVEPDGQTVLTSDVILTLQHLPRIMAVVGAGNAANKLALIRQATGAVVPAIAEQATGAVVPTMTE
jgi:NAD(P) transhydrogenase